MEEVTKLISTYGLAVMISGVVIYFGIKFGNILLKDFEDKRATKKHGELASLRTEVSSTINAMLERIVLRTHACRAYVFEFHNGSMSMGGLPFLKMTNTYEALNEGTQSELHTRENMPMQLFSSFVDAICSKEYLVMDVNNRTGECSQFIYETLVERGISVTVHAKISDTNKRVIGYFGIDYCNDKPVNPMTVSESVGVVQTAAVELGALLSVQKISGRMAR